MIWLVAAIVTLGLPPLARTAESATTQEPGGRFKVLVVPLNSRVLDKKFGEKVAEKLIDRIDDMDTHSAIPEREYERTLKKYDVKEEDLNAIRARQLANLIGAQVVYYGEVVRTGTGYEVRSSFIDVQTGDEVAVPPIPIADKSEDSQEAVTEATLAAFQEQIRFVRARAFCAVYVGSQQVENALRNCNEALEINPNSVPALFNKGLAFRLLFESDTEGTNGWADSAVAYFERVLEIQPGKKEALENAAYIESRMGNAERASELYKQFLELDPTNVPVRLKVAYDLAQASLMAEAIAIIEEAFQYEENNADLLQFLGDYALRYATDLEAENPAEASIYVDKALAAYEKILELKGEETELAIIENALAAYTKAGRSNEAAAFAERALEAHSDSPRLWSLYADALGRLERYADASQAMDRALAIDGAYPNGYLKRGLFKLRNGDEAGAMRDFELALSAGTSTQYDLFNLFWAEGIRARSEGKYGEAIENFEQAAKYADSSGKPELEFWWAYTYYQLGEKIAGDESASVNQLKRAQMAFQNAQTHFTRAGNVRSEVPALKDATGKWLLNVEARIKRAQRN